MRPREIEPLLRHGEFLKALARSILKDPASADDVVQETWLAALEATSRPQQLHRGWLAGILQNLALRTIRDASRRAQRERAIAPERYAPPTDDLFTRHAFLRRIATLLATLPDTYRVPLVLRYREGLETAAIATRLGLAPSTVRTRIQRGLQRLRELLREDGAEPPAAALLPLLACRRSFSTGALLVSAKKTLLLLALVGVGLLCCAQRLSSATHGPAAPAAPPARSTGLAKPPPADGAAAAGKLVDPAGDPRSRPGPVRQGGQRGERARGERPRRRRPPPAAPAVVS